MLSLQVVSEQRSRVAFTVEELLDPSSAKKRNEFLRFVVAEEYVVHVPLLEKRGRHEVQALRRLVDDVLLPGIVLTLIQTFLRLSRVAGWC